MQSRYGEKEISFFHIWRNVFGRKGIILSFISACVVLAVIYSLAEAPEYKAVTTLMIEKPESGTIDIQDFLEMKSGRFQRYASLYETRLKLLSSRSLAERVVARLVLTSPPELLGRAMNRAEEPSFLKHFFSLSWLFPLSPREKGNADAAESETPESQAAMFILRHLKIRPFEGTSLVEVQMISRDPFFSAEVVNTLADEFINYSKELIDESARYGSGYLDGRIAQLHNEIIAGERELQNYAEGKELPLPKEKESPLVLRFENLVSDFSQARIERIDREAVYRELMDIGLISRPESFGDPALLRLKQDYTRVKSELFRNSFLLRPDYALIRRLNARLSGIRSEMDRGINRALLDAEESFVKALDMEESLSDVLESLRAEVIRTDDNAILYRCLKIEVENMRALKDSLTFRQRENRISSSLYGWGSASVRVIDEALVPGKPVAGDILRILFFALILGLVFGVSTAALVEYFDNSIRDPEEVEDLVGLPSLGMIPHAGTQRRPRKKPFNFLSSLLRGEAGSHRKTCHVKEIELINHLYPDLSVAEDYRTVRTSIMFSRVDNPPQVITVTSVFPREGKTSTVSNLAVCFSQLRKRVLLIDADLRKPRLHEIFNVDNSSGLSSCLNGSAGLDEIVHLTSIKNLWVIPSGPKAQNPAELLASGLMKDLTILALARFDLILIDSPPVESVIDAVILGHISDSLVLVVQPGKTTRRALVKAVEDLKKSATQILGVVYNEMRLNRGGIYCGPSYLSYMDEYHETKK